MLLPSTFDHPPPELKSIIEPFLVQLDGFGLPPAVQAPLDTVLEEEFARVIGEYLPEAHLVRPLAALQDDPAGTVIPECFHYDARGQEILSREFLQTLSPRIGSD